MLRLTSLVVAVILVAFSHLAWAQQHSHPTSVPPGRVAQTKTAPQPKAAPAAPAQPRAAPQGAVSMGDMHAPRSFTLRSGIAEGRMVYLGVGGDID